MKLKTKLIMLVLTTATPFIIAFFFVTFMSLRGEKLREEKEILDQLRISALEVESGVSHLFLDHDISLQWSHLTGLFEERKSIYNELDQKINYDKAGQIGRIEDLEIEKYYRLNESYRELNESLLKLPNYRSGQYRLSLIGTEIGDNESLPFLRYMVFANNFIYRLSDFSFTISTSYDMAEKRISNIEKRLERTRRSDNLTLVLISSALVLIPLILSLRMAGNIGSDARKIEESVALMINEGKEKPLKITRNDEIGWLACNLEVMIGNLQKARERLIESEKMASLATLTIGLAHEINTPLGICVTASSYCSNLLETLHDDIKKEHLKDFGRSIEMINVNLTKLSDLVTSFRELNMEHAALNKAEVNLGLYLKELIKVEAKIRFPGPYDLQHDLTDGIYGFFDCSIFRQILFQLIDNSLTHGLDGKDGDYISILLTEDEGEACLIYKDNGRGLSEEERKHIFEPFYTTGRSNGKLGLGLYFLYNLVTVVLKGSVSCETAEGKGTTFSITFPVQSNEGL